MRKRKNRIKIKNKKKFYTILTIVFILVASGIAYGAHTYQKLKKPQDLFVPTQGGEEIDINGQFDKNIVNILLVGFDKDEVRAKDSDLFRTDTNIVVTINLEEKTVDMISIPRDSYVEIAHRGGKDKFNAAFGYGYRFGETGDKEKDGFKYLMDTSSELLGDIPIYYYTAVDMDVVKEIVDAIGGVEMEVPIDLYKRHGKDRSEIIVPKGYKKLDGHDLLYYARYRHYPKGDIQRAENQQKILLAIFDSLKESNMFSSLPKIYQSVQKNIKTNLNINQIAALALFGKDMNKENIQTHMIPGDFGELSGLSYWIIDQDKKVDLIKDIYGITAVAKEQDPTEDKLISLKGIVSRNIIEIGESIEIVAKGKTTLGHEKLFDPGDVSYYSSNKNIASVNYNGIITAIGAGNATITLTVGEISQNINITVKSSKDTTAPIISLKGSEAMTLNIGDTFIDPGATARDNVDGDLTNRMKITGSVDTSKAGTYIRAYTVNDAAGNSASKKRTIIVKEKTPSQDTIAPTIKLNGSVEITMQVGSTYKELGATATDNIDGNISNKVKINGYVDTSKAGTYTITYSVVDRAGNGASATRKVIVNEPATEPKPPADAKEL